MVTVSHPILLVLAYLSAVPSVTPLHDLPRCSTVRSYSSVCGEVLETTHAYEQILYTVGPIGNDDVETFISLARVLDPPVPDTCIDLLVHLLCFTATPPCNRDTGLPMLICEDSCMLFKQIKEAGFCDVIQERVALLEMVSTFFGFEAIADAFFQFNCSDPTSYFFMDVAEWDSASCTSIFSTETQEIFKSDLCEVGVGPNCTADITMDCSDCNTNETAIEIKDSSLLLLKTVLPPVGFVVLVTIITLLIVFTCYFTSKRRKLLATFKLVPKRSSGSLVGGTGPHNDTEQKMNVEELDVVVEEDSVIEKYKAAFSSITIPYSDLIIGAIIGQGSFGKVYEGKLCSSDDNIQITQVAIKMIKSSDLKSFLVESTVMRDFSHPNVLGLVGVVFDTPDGTPHLVLPFMDNGNLKNFLKSKRESSLSVSALPKNLQISDLVRMCLDITHGMEYLADKKFVHRDLAARNCMLDKDLQVKVGDFGLSRDIYTTDYYRINDKSANLPVKWLPPETFNDGISNEKTDIWAFGVTCWEVFSLGRTPYPTVPNTEMFNYISEGERLEKPNLCPQEMFDIVFQCWTYKPEERPNFKELANILSDYWEEKHSYVT